MSDPDEPTPFNPETEPPPIIEPEPLVDPTEASLPGGLQEPPADPGLQQVQAVAFQAAKGLLEPLVTTMTPENMGRRLAMIHRVGALLNRLSLEVGHPEVFNRRHRGLNAPGALGDMFGRRETAGVQAIKEMVSSVTQSNRPSLERRLSDITVSMKDAQQAGATELYEKLKTHADLLADAIAKQPIEIPNPAIEQLGKGLGTIANAVEGSGSFGLVAPGSGDYDSDDVMNDLDLELGAP